MAIVASGDWWTLDDNGKLRIFCEGDMPLPVDTAPYEPDGPPWLRPEALNYADAYISSVVIADTVTGISCGAFLYHENLLRIQIPRSVVKIKSYAFMNCHRLTDIYYAGTKLQWDTISIDDGNPAIVNAAIHYIQPLTVNVAYTDPASGNTFQTSFDVEVKPVVLESKPVVLESLEITPPTKIDYLVGEALDYTGLVVIGVFSDGTMRSITQECTFSPAEGEDVLDSGAVSVSVSHPLFARPGSFNLYATIGEVTTRDSWYTLYSSGFMDVYCYGEMPDSSQIDDYPNKYFMWLDMSPITFVLFEDTVTVIGEYAFAGCTNLAGVSIGSGVTTIEDQAFSQCTKLKKIIIPRNVTSIGHGIVEYTPITSITIPDSISIIPSYMCYECKQLTHVELPDTITEIRYGAFQNCSSLREITIPPHVTFLGQNVFTNSALTHITIPDSVTRIDDSAFSCCDNLTAITIPNSVTEMGEWLFSSCVNLESVRISNRVTEIGEGTFNGCSSLASITIPDSVTSIGGYAFSGCTGLTAVNIPDSVTSIGEYAFTGCTGLTAVNIPDSVTSIDWYAFDDCASLADVYYSGTAQQWAEISIGSSNTPLTSATIHYNSTGPS